MALPTLMSLKELTTIRGSAEYGESHTFERTFRAVSRAQDPSYRGRCRHAGAG